METQRESIRKTVTIPSELWTKVRIEKIQKGDESLSDVVVRALEEHFQGEEIDPCRSCAEAAHYPDNCGGCNFYEPIEKAHEEIQRRARAEAA